MNNTVNINKNKENTLEFMLTVEGLPSVDGMDVRLCIKTQKYDYVFKAVKDIQNTFKVQIPPMPEMEKTMFPCVIEVITHDGYYFEAMRGNVNVVTDANITAQPVISNQDKPKIEPGTLELPLSKPDVPEPQGPINDNDNDNEDEEFEIKLGVPPETPSTPTVNKLALKDKLADIIAKSQLDKLQAAQVTNEDKTSKGSQPIKDVAKETIPIVEKIEKTNPKPAIKLTESKKNDTVIESKTKESDVKNIINENISQKPQDKKPEPVIETVTSEKDEKVKKILTESGQQPKEKPKSSLIKKRSKVKV